MRLCPLADCVGKACGRVPQAEPRGRRQVPPKASNGRVWSRGISKEATPAPVILPFLAVKELVSTLFSAGQVSCVSMSLWVDPHMSRERNCASRDGRDLRLAADGTASKLLSRSFELEEQKYACRRGGLPTWAMRSMLPSKKSSGSFSLTRFHTALCEHAVSATLTI